MNKYIIIITGGIENTFYGCGVLDKNDDNKLKITKKEPSLFKTRKAAKRAIFKADYKDSWVNCKFEIIRIKLK